jgi:hypothetical protein
MKLIDRWSGLILNERTGKVVGTKLASATGHLTMFFFFCWHNFHTGFNETMWLIYAGLIMGHKTLEKVVGMKYGSGRNENVYDQSYNNVSPVQDVANPDCPRCNNNSYG